MDITHIEVYRRDRTPTVRVPPCFISFRERSAHKEARIVKICSGANADIKPRHIIRAEKVWGLIARALLVLCTTKPPHRR